MTTPPCSSDLVGAEGTRDEGNTGGYSEVTLAKDLNNKRLSLLPLVRISQHKAFTDVVSNVILPIKLNVCP